MKLIRNTPWLFILCTIIVSGCGPDIPTAKYPAREQKLLHASFDEVWNNTLETVKTLGGTIIAQDRSSGFITSKISLTYINTYIRGKKNESAIVVFMVPYSCTSYPYSLYTSPEQNVSPGKYFTPKQIDILEIYNVNFQKDYSPTISDVFFDKLGHGTLKDSKS